MNNRLLIVLGFALVVSAGASVVLYKFVAAGLTTKPSTPTTTVVVAVRALPVGTLIKGEDVKMAPGASDLPHGAIVKVEDAVGRGVIAAIVANEPLVDERLAPKGGGAGLAATIPSGMRAVAVSVNEVVGVAGFVTPGMHVDVLVSGNPPGASAAVTGPQTRTALQDIPVLSAGQNFQKDAEGKPIAVQVVNLLVTPEQAEILSLATHETRIQLVLRNPLDREISKTPGTAVTNLFGGQVKEPVVRRPVVRKPVIQAALPAKAPVPVIVEVLHGDKKTELRFQPDQESTKQ